MNLPWDSKMWANFLHRTHSPRVRLKSLAGAISPSTDISHRSQCRLGRTSLIDFVDKSDGLSNISLYSTMSALSLDITYCIRILKKGIIPVTDSYLNKQKYFKKTLNNKILISSLHQFDYQYCGKYVHCNNQQIKSFL